MPLNNQGSNLIFLISLPRSGSTMLQKIICNNLEVHTTSEPWIMLHPIYALRSQGYSAEYNAQWAYRARQIFTKCTFEGEDVYYEGLRLMFSHIYEAVLNKSGKKYFLDKTPRYYEIIPELHNIFPKAKFIFLLRNPLAILNSRINLLPNAKDLTGLKMYSRDFMIGPNKLIEGIDELSANCFVLKYEELVLYPEIEIKKLCNYIGIPYSSNMLKYNDGDAEVLEFGDPITVYDNDKPNPKYSEGWLESLVDPQLWRLFFEYYSFLGDDFLKKLGYYHDEIIKHIIETQPNKFKLLLTKSLRSLIDVRDNVK